MRGFHRRTALQIGFLNRTALQIENEGVLMLSEGLLRGRFDENEVVSSYISSRAEIFAKSAIITTASDMPRAKQLLTEKRAQKKKIYFLRALFIDLESEVTPRWSEGGIRRESRTP